MIEVRQGFVNSRERGSEILEFALVFLPMMALVSFLGVVGWAIFTNSTLQRAVRVGVTTGTRLTGSQLSQGACLTDTVKSTVQQNAMGFLAGSSGLSLIKVNYYQPPAPNSTGALTDVTSQANANIPGNIMQVSVPSYSILPLMGRIIGMEAADNTPITIGTFAAGMIEPTQNLPCMGTAP